MAPTDIVRNTLSVLVQDVDGIISRVAGMFTRRGYNLISLVSANTETEGINRITIVVDANELVIEQVTKQLNKIIPVLKVVRLEEESTIARGGGRLRERRLRLRTILRFRHRGFGHSASGLALLEGLRLTHLQLGLRRRDRRLRLRLA